MLSFDALNYPYASRRNVVYAKRCMVATLQPLAAQAGRIQATFFNRKSPRDATIASNF